MRQRPPRPLAAAAAVVLFLGVVGLAGGCSSYKYDGVAAHVKAAVASAEDSDVKMDEAVSLKFMQAASGPKAKQLVAQAESSADTARKEIAAAQADLKKAPESDAKKRWMALLGEAGLALDDHGAGVSSESTFVVQSIAAGNALRRIEAADTKVDKALALTNPGSAAAQLRKVRLEYVAVSRDLAPAHKLEPKAGLDKLAASATQQARAVALHAQAAEAAEKGQEYSKLFDQAEALWAGTNAMEDPAMFSSSYGESFGEDQTLEDVHTKKVVAQLEALGFSVK
jgi:hypothetical protein